MKKIICLLMGLLITVPFVAQTEIVINGYPADNTCMSVRTVDGELETMPGRWVGIYHAEINGDCLELSIQYGGCTPEMEFITNNIVLESQASKISFLLKYMKSDSCKDNQKTKLKFDLLPFKNMKPGKVIFISLVGTPFTLGYRQRE